MFKVHQKNYLFAFFKNMRHCESLILEVNIQEQFLLGIQGKMLMAFQQLCSACNLTINIFWMQVSKPGSVKVERLMNVERYSHVMHISSTVSNILITFCFSLISSSI